MDYQVVLETDPGTCHVMGTVIGIPEIIVDALSEEQALDDLRVAIEMALEDPVVAARRPGPMRVATLAI